MTKWPLFILFLGLAYTSKAQISSSNLMEYQFGKLPSDTVKSFLTLYDRAKIDYSYKAFRAGLTLEQFWTPYSDRNSIRLNQARLQYYSSSFEVKIGNFYETLGRGILFRSFEIPGSILEDISYRSKHYFHRDIAGLSVKYRYQKLSVKGIFGWPLNNVFPPTQSIQDRRSDRVGSIFADYQLKNHIIGGSVMNLQNANDNSWF